MQQVVYALKVLTNQLRHSAYNIPTDTEHEIERRLAEPDDAAESLSKRLQKCGYRLLLHHEYPGAYAVMDRNGRLVGSMQGSDEVEQSWLDGEPEAVENARQQVPEWLTRRARDAGCSVSLDDDGMLNVISTANPDGPEEILGASIVEAGKFIAERAQAKDTDDGELTELGQHLATLYRGLSAIEGAASVLENAVGNNEGGAIEIAALIHDEAARLAEPLGYVEKALNR